MQFPFGPFAPDAGVNAPGICVIAEGVLPDVDSYGPAPALVQSGTSALPSAPRGAITTIKRDGTVQVFMFTATAFYRLDASYAFIVVASGYNCTPGDDWSLEQFGDILLYTNTTDGLWAYNIETGGTPVYIPDAGDPREVFINANMIFAFDCKNNAGARNNRLIRNSDFNDHTEWKRGAADQQPLEGGGELVGGSALKNGAAAVLQRDSLRLIQFGAAGGSALYGIQEIADGRGSVGKKSIIGFDGVIYFLSTNGFYRFSQAGLEAIGDGAVDRWFSKLVPTGALKDIQAAIDPSRKIVLWLYPAGGFILGFSWAPNVTRRWFVWPTTATFLSRLATSGYTWNAAGAIWPTWDSMPQIPFNDRFWQGGQQFLAALGANMRYASFSGDAQAIRLRTSTGNSPISTKITRATPIDDFAAGTLSLGVADSLDEPLVWLAAEAKTTAGETPQLGRGKNIAWERNIPALTPGSYIKGVDHIKASGGGAK